METMLVISLLVAAIAAMGAVALSDDDDFSRV
jgi:hypothetical protein